MIEIQDYLELYKQCNISLFLVHSQIQDVAQLIMERTTVLNHVLPQDNRPGTDVQNSALMALINLYANYLRKAKEYDTEAYSWASATSVYIFFYQFSRLLISRC